MSQGNFKETQFPFQTVVWFAIVCIKLFFSVAPSPAKMLCPVHKVCRVGVSTVLYSLEGHLLPWETKAKLIEAPWDIVPLLKILSELKD